jgi:hypothetical protein
MAASRDNLLVMVLNAAKDKDTMDFKPAEIAGIIVAFLIPIVGFAIVLTPGGFDAVLNFLFGAGTRNYVFGAAAFAVMCVLGQRIYRRIRPPETKKKHDPNAPPNFFDFFRFDVWRDHNKD